METIVASRIRQRMEELGKNPSQVALDAGLGRSAVRDILSGKAKNPGYMTLARIARELDCLPSYLTGDVAGPHEIDDPSRHANFEQRTDQVSGYIEAGVFRQYRRLIDLPDSDFDVIEAAEPFGLLEEKPFRSDYRYHGRDLLLFTVRDNALAAVSIVAGDTLTVLSASLDDKFTLNSGSLVVCLFTPDAFEAYELSSREVVVSGDGSVTLVTRSREHAIPSIKLMSLDRVDGSSSHPRFKAQGGVVEVIGHVVRVSREVPVT